MNTPLERVIRVISNVLECDTEEIKLASSLRGDLSADELDIIELIMDFEDEFIIEINTDKFETLHTVGEVVNYIDSLY